MGFVPRWFCCSKPRTRVIRQVVASRTLYSNGLPIFRNPNNMTNPVALGAFRAVSNSNYAFLSPFFLLSAEKIFADFFLVVQVILTDDLQRLQFFTKPTCNEHNSFYLLVVCFEKIQLFDRFRPEDKRNSSLINTLQELINTCLIKELRDNQCRCSINGFENMLKDMEEKGFRDDMLI